MRSVTQLAYESRIQNEICIFFGYHEKLINPLKPQLSSNQKNRSVEKPLALACPQFASNK